jgi:shikimate 5-dehydrogenase
MQDKYLMAGVMGYPVMHSRSPLLHNYWLKQHSLLGHYMPLAIAPGDIEKALRALPALGFAGCNLTMPHKEKAIPVMDRVSPMVRKVGAMNCVVVGADGALEGNNLRPLAMRNHSCRRFRAGVPIVVRLLFWVQVAVRAPWSQVCWSAAQRTSV